MSRRKAKLPSKKGLNLGQDRCVVNWPAEGVIRARKVVSRSNCKVTGKFPSRKVGRMVEWESPLELDAFVLCEVDPEVLTYREQPARIDYEMFGEIRSHFPDLYVVRREGGFFSEVKTDKEGAEFEVQERTSIVSRLLKYQGYGYELLTESEIRKQPRLTNAKFLIRAARGKVDIVAFERVRQIFGKTSNITIGDIKNGIVGERGMAIVSRLVMQGVLALDLNYIWNDDSVIRVV